MVDPLDGTTALQYRHMTKVQQRVANKIVSDFGSTFSDRARTQGKRYIAQHDADPTHKDAPAKRAKGRRLVAIADVHEDKPLTLASAAKNRVDAVTMSATTMRKPSEAIGGLGWYHDAHAEIAKKAAGLPIDVVSTASSIMSPGASPETERASTAALAAAHQNPEAHVHFSSKLVGDLRAAGHSVPVPVGETLHFSQVPAHLVPLLAHSHREEALKNSGGVDWAGISSIASRENVTKATKVMRGEIPLSESQNPYTAPKTNSYSHDLVHSVPGTPEHTEYMMRGADTAAAIRGDTGRVPGQLMLDYHGLRSSNEGTLSNNGPTAEDNWMRAASVGHLNPATLKGAGDINPTNKSYKTHKEINGETVSAIHSASRNPEVKANSVYHAWNNEATHQASLMIQKEHGLDYTVPSQFVQETAWTGLRRHAGADPDFNAENRETAKASRAEARATRTPAPQTHELLPGMNTAKFRAAAKGPAAAPASRNQEFHQQGLF